MLTTLLIIAINLAATALLSWFVYDALKKEINARFGALQDHFRALENRFEDYEEAFEKHKKDNAEVAYRTGQELQAFENKLSDLEENTVSATAINSLNDEFFSLKSAVQAFVQNVPKKKQKAKKSSKRR